MDKINEQIEFRKLLRKWGANQPGHVPLVTDAEVKAMMTELEKTRPFNELAASTVPPQALKAAILKSVITYQQVSIVKFPSKEIKDAVNQLVHDKLVELKSDTKVHKERPLEVTDLGRRFFESGMRDKDVALWVDRLVTFPAKK